MRFRDAERELGSAEASIQDLQERERQRQLRDIEQQRQLQVVIGKPLSTARSKTRETEPQR